jgi:hypothetical protein
MRLEVTTMERTASEANSGSAGKARCGVSPFERRLRSSPRVRNGSGAATQPASPK